MTFKYEPFTRVKWLMEEQDYTLEEAEKKASEPVNITEIGQVYWKIEGESLNSTDYCFRTKDDVFIDEAEYSTDEFMLEMHPDGQYHILALSDEDFYTSDDVSDQFDVDKILEECQAEVKEREGTNDPVINRYDDYMEFLKERAEDEDDNESMIISINL